MTRSERQTLVKLMQFRKPSQVKLTRFTVQGVFSKR